MRVHTLLQMLSTLKIVFKLVFRWKQIWRWWVVDYHFYGTTIKSFPSLFQHSIHFLAKLSLRNSFDKGKKHLRIEGGMLFWNVPLKKNLKKCWVLKMGKEMLIDKKHQNFLNIWVTLDINKTQFKLKMFSRSKISIVHSKTSILILHLTWFSFYVFCQNTHWHVMIAYSSKNTVKTNLLLLLLLLITKF